MDKSSLSYSNYLQLDQLLTAQQPQSTGPDNKACHDETLFIITHQTYELWFKQINYELQSVMQLFAQESLDERELGLVVARMGRVHSILKLLVEQIDILETMNPMDFLDFRHSLGAASGFQSAQFRELEWRMGRHDLSNSTLVKQLSQKEQTHLLALFTQSSLFDFVNSWLENMPFLDYINFDFWSLYQQAIKEMLNKEAEQVSLNTVLSEKEKALYLQSLTESQSTFSSFFNPPDFAKAQAQWQFRFSHKALLSALFINLYQQEPILHLPFTFLQQLTDIDDKLVLWRQRHIAMVQRMIGTKMGTGGSAGQNYLLSTLEKSRVYRDLGCLSNFLIPHSALPALPKELTQLLDFYFSSSLGKANTSS